MTRGNKSSKIIAVRNLCFSYFSLVREKNVLVTNFLLQKKKSATFDSMMNKFISIRTQEREKGQMSRENKLIAPINFTVCFEKRTKIKVITGPHTRTI